MLKTKVKISDVSNLTDARYFAAWGVDWMGFNADYLYDNDLIIEGIKEIMNWVEGPKFVVEFNQVHELSYIEEILNKLKTPFVQFKELEEYSNISLQGIDLIRDFSNKDLPDDQGIFISKQLTIENKHNDQIILYDGQIDSSNIASILDGNIDGIVLRGGSEEKVGFKSYEELDEILEALED